MNQGTDDPGIEWDDELYAELHSMAHRELRAERPEHTLQATALVHEAYLRLAGQKKGWAERDHFLALAARMMRRALVDHARRRAADRRGGDRTRVYLTQDAAAAESPLDLLDLEEALVRLERAAPRKARLAELHLFGGLGIGECAVAMSLSRRSATDLWAFARAWLKKELSGSRKDRGSS